MKEIQIARLRQERGWTQQRLAAESGVGVRTIQRLEAGKDASLETLHLVAKAFDLPVPDLFLSLEDAADGSAAAPDERAADRNHPSASSARALLGAIRRSLVLLVAVALLGAAVGVGIAVTRPVGYQATAQAFVSVNNRATGENVPGGSSIVMSVARSYADVATTPIVMSRVRKDLSTRATVGELAHAVTGSVASTGPVLSITARADSPTSAARIADAVLLETAAMVSQLSPAGGPTAAHVTPIKRATPTRQPAAPADLFFDGGIGLLAGLLLASVIVALRSRRRPGRREPDAFGAVAIA